MKRIGTLAVIATLAIVGASPALAGEKADDQSARVQMEGRKLVWKAPAVEAHALTGSASAEKMETSDLRVMGRSGYARR